MWIRSTIIHGLNCHHSTILFSFTLICHRPFLLLFRKEETRQGWKVQKKQGGIFIYILIVDNDKMVKGTKKNAMFSDLE